MEDNMARFNISKAEHVGVRDFRDNLFTLVKSSEPLVITEHGKPSRAVLDYNDLLDLLDILDELNDPEAVEAVVSSRKSINSGVQGIPVSELFQKIKNSRKKNV